MARSKDDLVSIEVRNGVNEKGEGFITLVAQGGDGRLLLAQMSPDEVRNQALIWLSVAEAAEQDAAVLRLVRKLELPEELAGHIIAELRDSRSE